MKNRLFYVCLVLVIFGQQIFGMTGGDVGETKPLLAVSGDGKHAATYSGGFWPDTFLDYIRAGNFDGVCTLLEQNTRYATFPNNGITPLEHAFGFALKKTQSRDCKYFKILHKIYGVVVGPLHTYVGQRRPLGNAPRVCCCVTVYDGPWLHQAVDCDNRVLVTLLLDNKMVAINDTNSRSLNALAFAQSREMAQLLIKNGIDVNTTNPSGNGLRAVDIVESEEVRRVIESDPQHKDPGCSCLRQMPGCIHVLWDCLDWLRCCYR